MFGIFGRKKRDENKAIVPDPVPALPENDAGEERTEPAGPPFLHRGRERHVPGINVTYPGCDRWHAIQEKIMTADRREDYEALEELLDDLRKGVAAGRINEEKTFRCRLDLDDENGVHLRKALREELTLGERLRVLSLVGSRSAPAVIDGIPVMPDPEGKAAPRSHHRWSERNGKPRPPLDPAPYPYYSLHGRTIAFDPRLLQCLVMELQMTGPDRFGAGSRMESIHRRSLMNWTLSSLQDRIGRSRNRKK